MITANGLSQLVGFVFASHEETPTKLSNAVRKWDGKTPYGVHPTWCAMTLLTETLLPEKIRTVGAQVLLLHDILEDTTTELPDEISDKVARLVMDMTFASSDEEMVKVWTKSIEVKLLKLYDKVSNLLDGSWMSADKHARYASYTLRLCDEVEKHYGTLNIVTITRAIV